MSFFEDALLTAKNAAGVVCEKTGRAVDISKLRLSAAEITKEIERRYEALGRLVYDSNKAGTDIGGLMEECVRSIDALYNRLDDVNGRIAKLKDKKYCAACGAVLDRSAVYCARCGSRVNAAENSADDAAKAAETAKAAAEKAAQEAEKAAEAAKSAAETAAEECCCDCGSNE